VAGLWFPQIGGAVLSAVFLNLFVFGFLGALVGVTWMNKRHIPRVFQVIVIMMLITSQTFPMLLALAIVGMLDTWYDYRRLAQPPAPVGAPGGAEPQPVPGTSAP
jgi:LytS/YehU family sensor histidine kinase